MLKLAVCVIHQRSGSKHHCVTAPVGLYAFVLLCSPSNAKSYPVVLPQRATLDGPVYLRGP